MCATSDTKEMALSKHCLGCCANEEQSGKGVCFLQSFLAGIWAEQGASTPSSAGSGLLQGYVAPSGAISDAGTKQQVRGTAGAAAATLQEPTALPSSPPSVCALIVHQPHPVCALIVHQQCKQRERACIFPLCCQHLHGSGGLTEDDAISMPRTSRVLGHNQPLQWHPGTAALPPPVLQPIQAHKFSIALYRLIFEHLPDTSSLYYN